MQENAPSESSRPGLFATLKRNAKWIVGGVVLFVVVLVLSIPLIVRAIIRYEIAAAVSSNLNATLEIDDLSWHPLLSVGIGHARLMGTGPDGSPMPLAELSGLDVSLAGIPSSGPIMVSNFKLLDPSIILTHYPSGEIQLEQNLVRPKTTPSAKTTKKPSELVQIKHFEISNLTVMLREWKSASPPQLLAKVDVGVDQTAGSADGYTFHVAAVNKPLTDLQLDGSANLDGATLTLKTFTLNAQVPDEAGLSKFPQPIQDMCKKYHLPGNGIALAVDDGATISVDSAKSHWTIRGLKGDLKPTNQSGTQLASGRIQFNIIAGGPLPGAGVPAGMDYLTALDHDTAVSVLTDPQAKINLTSPQLPQPVTDASGSIQYADGKLAVKDVDLKYGGQPIRLQTTAALVNDKFQLQGFHLQAAKGTLTVDAAEFGLAAPHNLSAHAAWQDIQLEELTKIALIKDPQGHLSGRVNGELTVSGAMPATNASPLVSIAGNGAVNATQGDFFDLPVLGDIAKLVSPTFGTVGRIGDAATVFTFDKGTLHMSKLAVSCPLIGIQGSGDAGMTEDNQLNMTFTATPLAGLKQQADQVGIPGLSQAIGQAQNSFNQVQKALYGFSVTGPALHPRILPVPAAGLDSASKDVMGQVLNGVQGGSSGAGGLLDLLQGKKKKGSK